MTPFEYFVSMILSLIASFICATDHKWWIRGISAMIIMFMSFFAGYHKGVLIS